MPPSKEPELSIVKAPALIVIFPVKVLAPESVNVLSPNFVKAPPPFISPVYEELFPVAFTCKVPVVCVKSPVPSSSP